MRGLSGLSRDDVVKCVRKVFESSKGFGGLVVFATLFGSVVKGCVHALSDVDVAVYLRRALQLGDYACIASSVARVLGVVEDCVDLLDLSVTTSLLSFFYEAVARGVLVYCSDREFYEKYLYRVVSMYLDFRVFEKKHRLTERLIKAVMKRG